MTDLERLAVAWETARRTSRAVATGLRIGPLLVGGTLTLLCLTAQAIRPMVA